MAKTRQVQKPKTMNVRLPLSVIDATDGIAEELFPGHDGPSRSKMLTAAVWAGLSVMRRERWERYHVYALAEGVQVK